MPNATTAATAETIATLRPTEVPHNPAMTALRFGIEIETVHTSLRSRLAVAERVAAVLGEGFSAIDNGADRYGNRRASVVLPDGRKWNIDGDGSIVGGFDCEFVSPILTWADMDLMQRFIRAIRKAGCRVNSSCGIHIHVDGARFKAEPSKLVNLIKLVNKREDLIHAMLGNVRSGSRWCRNMNTAFADRVTAGRISTETGMRDAWFSANGGSYGDAAYRASRHGDMSRYHGLNLHSLFHLGTVEFRYFDAANLHAGKIRSYVCLCLALAGKALSLRSVAKGSARVGRIGAYRVLYHDLGLRGAYFANVRDHLMAKLPEDDRRVPCTRQRCRAQGRTEVTRQHQANAWA